MPLLEMIAHSRWFDELTTNGTKLAHHERNRVG
jgi:hypothetical protein